MSRASFSSRLFWLVTLAMCLVGAVAPATRAQAPNADQMQIFRNLSPDQQRAILEALSPGDAGTTDRETTREGSTRSEDGSSERRPREDSDSSDLQLDLEREREPRFKPLDTLLVTAEIREFKGQGERAEPPVARVDGDGQPVVAPVPREPIVRSDDERKRLEELRTRILRRNPLQLDKWGILNSNELGPIPLAGLTAEEARLRLSAEPLLSDFILKVTYLPVKPVGPQSLKPFGYQLFDESRSTFAPAADIPVPSEYVVGPGDTLEVQLIGTVKGRSSLVVRRDGRVSFPELGPIAVGGMRFEEVRSMLERRVAEQLIGTQASVYMGELRSIQVYVVGDAQQPGSYTVNGLSTITNALFVSGGVRRIGSLRNIELKRDGQTVSRLDLYELLLRGNTRADARLQNGDVILVPPVGRMVGITGEVQRPALYELKQETSVAEIVALAGGPTAEADTRLVTVDRIDAARKRTVLDVDLTGATASMNVLNGDIVNVPAIRPTVDDAITVRGHTHRPGQFQYRPGLRVSDVLPSLEELRPMADQHYVLIRREVPATHLAEFISVDLAEALARRGSEADAPLAPRDQIFVFDLETGRDRILQPLLRELRLQATRDAPTASVTISGRVNVPGQYPLERGMRVSDLVRAGGSLNEAAYGGTAELTRNSIEQGQVRRTELVEIDLARAIAGDPTANLELRPYDYLIVKELPLWGAQEYVEMQGEVRFPGRYPIQRGETLKSVVQRAGGLTELAFAEGSIFTRQSLKDRERTQIDGLVERLQRDLAQVALTAAQEARGNAAQALSVGQQLLDNLRNAEPVGRLVINLDGSMVASSGTSQDIVLKDGDRLAVPRVTQEVTVIGEVQSPTSHLYSGQLSSGDYVDMSGGPTQRADKGRTYVVRADGSVLGGNSGRWFSGRTEVRPGDTVVVPLDAERVSALPLWTAITSVLANLAISAAALASL